MNFIKIKKIATRVLVILFIVSQFAGVGYYLLTPKPAQAFWGIGDFDFSTTIIDIPKNIEKIVTGLLQRVAVNYANKYLTRLVNKIQDKYRIKDFLFYDQYLTDYYVTNLITKNVQDPDLRRALELMNSITITGRTQGYSGAPDPAKALIPQFRLAVNKIYAESGGISNDIIFNPPETLSSVDYYSAAQSYWLNPPSFTEQNLRAQFGAFQSAATTAAQLEILVGNGLKAGRVIGGTCKANIPTLPKAPSSNRPSSFNNFESLINKLGLVRLALAQDLPSRPNPGGSTTPPEIPTNPLPGGLQPIPKDPVACAKSGGSWQPPLLDQAKSLITNPTAFIDKTVGNIFGQIFKNNFDASNIYTQVGQALGDFMFTTLNLNDSAGVFNELPGDKGYSPNSLPTSTLIKKVDLDGDSIPDGQDNDNDGKLTSEQDACYHGGLPPNCKKSSEVSGSAYFFPLCASVDRAIEELTSFLGFMETHKDQNKGTQDFFYEADAIFWAQRASTAVGRVNDLLQNIQDFGDPNFDNNLFEINRYSVYLDQIATSLYADSDVDLAGIFGTGDGGTFFRLRTRTANMIQYIKDFRKAIQKCDDPNSQAAGSLPPPDMNWPRDDTPEQGGGCYEGVDGDRAKYASKVSNALISSLNTYPDIADHKTNPALNPNSAEENTTMINHIVEHLRSSIGRAGRVIKCSGAPSDDKIMVGRFGDQYGEMYDIWTAFDGDLTFRQGANTQDVGLTEWRACDCNRDF